MNFERILSHLFLVIHSPSLSDLGFHKIYFSYFREGFPLFELFSALLFSTNCFEDIPQHCSKDLINSYNYEYSNATSIDFGLIVLSEVIILGQSKSCCHAYCSQSCISQVHTINTKKELIRTATDWWHPMRDFFKYPKYFPDWTDRLNILWCMGRVRLGHSISK